jgi:hypothetical protein
MGVGISGIKHELLWLYGQAAIYMGITIIYFFFRVQRENRKRELFPA